MPPPSSPRLPGQRVFREKPEAFPGTEEEEREEALRLAQVFFTHEAFAPFREGPVAKEVPVALEVEGVRLEGRADQVGADWVLDYKTDQEVDPRGLPPPGDGLRLGFGQAQGLRGRPAEGRGDFGRGEPRRGGAPSL